MPAVFGVTTADIEPLVLGAPISSDSIPSITQVTAWILTRDLIVQGVFTAKGVPVQFEVDSTGYAYGHQAVLTAVAAQVIQATQGKRAQAVASREEYLLAINELKQWVHVLGASVASDNVTDVPSSSSTPAMSTKRAAKTVSRRASMARSGVM